MRNFMLVPFLITIFLYKICWTFLSTLVLFWCQPLSVQQSERAGLLQNFLSLVLLVLSIFAIMMFLSLLVKALFDQVLASFWSTKRKLCEIAEHRTNWRSLNWETSLKEKTRKISSKCGKLKNIKGETAKLWGTIWILCVDWENVLHITKRSPWSRYILN